MARRALRALLIATSVFCAVIDKSFAVTSNANSTALIVFGSSWSDTGNLYALSQQPVKSLYYQGRFSDGPLWVDYVQRRAYPVVLNYAVGGATACPGAALFGHSGTAQDQVSQLTSRKLPPKDLGSASAAPLQATLNNLFQAGNSSQPGPQRVTVWFMIGNNDYLRVVLQGLQGVDPVAAVRALPDTAVNCTIAAVSQLVTAAQAVATTTGTTWKIMVASLPPLELAPLLTQITPTDFQAEMKQAVLRHNMLLQQAVQKSASTSSSVTIQYFDLRATVSDVRDTLFRAGADIASSCITHNMLYPAMRGMFAAAMPGGNSVLPPSWGYAASIVFNRLMAQGNAVGANSLSEGFFSTGSRCANASQFFWYDEVHPTTQVHQRLANAIN